MRFSIFAQHCLSYSLFVTLNQRLQLITIKITLLNNLKIIKITIDYKLLKFIKITIDTTKI